MNKHRGIVFCCTNMYIGRGTYSPNIPTRLYHASSIPQFLTAKDIETVNMINNSSVIMLRDLCYRIGLLDLVDAEDWIYWKKILTVVPYCLYLSEPLVYYDEGHCNGKNYVYGTSTFSRMVSKDFTLDSADAVSDDIK